MSFRKILCPTDFSVGAGTALRVAAHLAKAHDAELVLTHSWHVPSIAFADFTLPGELIRQLAEDAERGLADALREAKQLGAQRVTAKLTNGVAWQDIVDAAE